MGKILLYILFLLLSCSRTSAQVFDSTWFIPKSAIRNTSFTALFLMDSCSRAGDSALTETYLLRIDPFCLLRMNYTPASLDSFFAGYCINFKTREEFRRKFETIYNIPETTPYRTFKKMFEEDQAARYKLDKCNDSFSYAFYRGLMRQSDSVHFDYLYRYVKKNGWPKLSDGSLYAEILALHDSYHMKEYLPFMKKAVLAGSANYNSYCNVLNRVMKPPFEELAQRFKKKAVFDISYILNADTPTLAHVAEIKKAVKENVPIKYIYFVYEGNNKKEFENFCAARGGYSHSIGNGWDRVSCYWIAWDLLVRVEVYQRGLLQSDDNIPYQFIYTASESAKKKLTLYLLY